MKINQATIKTLTFIFVMSMQTLTHASQLEISKLGRDNQVIAQFNPNTRIEVLDDDMRYFIPEVPTGTCNCNTPSNIKIECGGDSWYDDTEFNYASQLNVRGLISARVRNAAWCSYSPDFGLDSEEQACPSRRTDACDQFCEEQFTNDMFLEIRDTMRECIDYFRNQCASTVMMLDGSHDENPEMVTYEEMMGHGDSFGMMNAQTARDDYGIYDVYGLCR